MTDRQLRESIELQQERFDRLWIRYLQGNRSSELEWLLARVALEKQVLVKRLESRLSETGGGASACTGVSQRAAQGVSV